MINVLSPSGLPELLILHGVWWTRCAQDALAGWEK